MPREHRTRRPMPYPLPNPSAPIARPPALRVVRGELVPSPTVDAAPARRRRWYVRLHQPEVPRTRRRPCWGRVAAWTLGGLLAAAAIAGLVWLIVLAVLELIAIVTALVALVVAWVQANWAWLVLGVIAVLALLVRLGSSSCAGLHCGGCRGGHR
jgi:hypothetical protein